MRSPGYLRGDYRDGNPAAPSPDPEIGHILIGESRTRPDFELEAILDGAFDEIFVADGSGVCLQVNKACERLYGTGKEELIGRHVSDLVRSGYFWPSATLEVLQRGERVTILQTTRSGRKVVATGNPVFDGKGNISRVVTTSRDVSELERLGREEKGARQTIMGLVAISEECSVEGVLAHGIITRNPQMQAVVRLALKAARFDTTLLLLGESGTGKDLMARTIHASSRRRAGPFITINCGALPEGLLESELFGYERGAFTGARREGKPGLLELGAGGTVFLDEVSELSPSLQVKLLHVLQYRTMYRLGGVKPVPADIRVIAASNQDLRACVEEGRFRADLYHRINVLPLRIPPLRERSEDIPLLAEHFLKGFNARYGVSKRFSFAVIDALVKYSWPGNVRELENVVERLAVSSETDLITEDALPGEIRASSVGPESEPPLRATLEQLEREVLADAYGRLKSSYKVARALGMSQAAVARRLKKYGLSKDKGRRC